MSEPIPFGPAWIGMLREIVQRDGQAVRSGAGNSIEARSLRTNEWMPIRLPDGTTEFPSTTERDQALARIQTP